MVRSNSLDEIPSRISSVQSQRPTSSEMSFENISRGRESNAVLTANNLKDVLPSSQVLVPKWAIATACLGVSAMMVLFGSVIVVYNAPRESLFLENCASRFCSKDLNLKCINKTCMCEVNYYYFNKCVPKLNYLDKCRLTYECKDNTSLRCFDGFCKCNETRYWNGSLCVKKNSFNQSCDSDTKCVDNSLLYCDLNKTLCLCPDNRYWGGEGCLLKRTVYEQCTENSDCLNGTRLFCIDSQCKCVSNQFWDSTKMICSGKGYEFDSCRDTTECLDPMRCTASGCQCDSNEYFDNSTLSCMPQRSYRGTCTITRNCRLDKQLDCINETCLCNDQYPTWSVERDTCILMSSYSESCLYQSDCNFNKLLVCNTGVSCSCPLQLSYGWCDCVRQVNNEYYWNGSICIPTVYYNQSCINASTSYMCRTLTEVTICSGAAGSFVCKCPQQFYYNYNSSKCVMQVGNNGACPQGDECRFDLGLSCRSGVCLCNTTIEFWNGGVAGCVNYYSYNLEACTATSQCRGNLVCRLAGVSPCNCPANITNKCDCVRVPGNESYYNVNTATCLPVATYGQRCNSSANYTCQTITQNLYCNSSGFCDCDTSECTFISNTCKCCSSIGSGSKWVHLNGTCYGIINTARTYNGSCNIGRNSTLTTFSDINAETFFKTYANNASYWVNAIRSNETNVFYSIDGTWLLNSTFCVNQTVTDRNFAYYDRASNCFGSQYANASMFSFCSYVL